MTRETNGVTWPEQVARQVGSLLATLADPDRSGRVVVHEVVRGLASLPGISEARLTARDEPAGERFHTALPIGQEHMLHLGGPDAIRPEIVQAAALVAEALAVRVRDATAAEGPSPADRLAFFQAIGQHAPFVIAVHDLDGKLRWQSGPAWGERLPDDEQTGISAPVHPEDESRLSDLRWRLVAESGDIAEIDVRHSGLEDDDWRHLHVVVRNMLDHPGVNGLVSYASDVTALRRTQHSERVSVVRLRTLIDAIDVAIVVVDEDMRLAEINPKALELMRVDATVDEVTGRTMPELVQLADEGRASHEVLQIAADFADRSIAGGVPVYGEELVFPDGIVLEADYLPIDIDGAVRGHFLVGREVSGRAAAQHALEVRNRELADLALLKNEFLATVSHELRSPLTAESSLLELLDESDPAAPPPRDLVDALRRNNRRLLTIVEDLLLLARFELNEVPLELRLVSTGELLGDRLAPLRADADRHHVSLLEVSCGQPADVLVDPHWLERMIRYVVSGSFAAGQPDRKITLRSDVGPERWTLTVSGDTLRTADSGPGEACGARHDRIGIGLGLTLARAIARSHGGDLRIEPDADGAVVTITLPLH
ncbi:MAG: histidine kinase dimerization/phospho-acceptor domain-containing protein [Labedaea sp.]